MFGGGVGKTQEVVFDGRGGNAKKNMYVKIRLHAAVTRSKQPGLLR